MYTFLGIPGIFRHKSRSIKAANMGLLCIGTCLFANGPISWIGGMRVDFCVYECVCVLREYLLTNILYFKLSLWNASKLFLLYLTSYLIVKINDFGSKIFRRLNTKMLPERDEIIGGFYFLIFVYLCVWFFLAWNVNSIISHFLNKEQWNNLALISSVFVKGN